MAYPEIKRMRNNPALADMARIINDIVFSDVIDGGLKLTLMLPWTSKDAVAPVRHPLIVFVQGCAWGFPNIYVQIPQLCQFARAGYAVATVTHRNAEEGHAFPAYLQDVKTAIRFLRANADEYGIDTERVCIWGTSSGANTAMLVGLTGDEERFKTAEYAKFSDRVNCVVECFGPTDLTRMMPQNLESMLLDPAYADLKLVKRFKGLAEGRCVDDVLRDMSPVNYIASCKNVPPMLILHGDADELVPYQQAMIMYERISAAGAVVDMICVEGAPHEGDFWSEELLQEIRSFIDKHIG